MLLQILADSSYMYTNNTTMSGSSEPSNLFLGIIGFIYITVAIISIVSLWKLFKKAGKPGWAAIVPVYNIWILFELVGFPGWLALLAFIPFVNFAIIVVEIIAYYKLAIAFGKSTGFAVATIFFPYVTLPMLAFSDARYQGVNGGAEQVYSQRPPQPPIAAD